jgi:class 3 adenylate cyclase
MKYFLKYNKFNESFKDSKKRSSRLLSIEHLSNNEIMEAKSNKLPSVMFTDVVGSSRMWTDDKMVMKKRIDAHFDLITDIVKKYDGFIVKTIGDAFMIYFKESEDSLSKAIECGLEILKSETLPLRVGICQGPMQEKTYTLQNARLKDFFGNVVNVASRMESKVADPEGIAFSSVVNVPKSIIKKYSPEVLEGDRVPDLKGASITKVYKIKA